MIGFIHITKTAGTDLKHRGKCEGIRYGRFHDEDALFYKKKSMKCFAILRCPIDRYKSLFFFNTRGSSRYKKPKSEYVDINHFVNDHYMNRELIKQYEGGWQFRKQSEWLLNADEDNTFIIKYDKKNLIKHIEELCAYNEIEFKYKEQTNPINRTNYAKKFELTHDSEGKILEMYHEDFKLFNNLIRVDSSFCKLKCIME
jgi:hypothetical protein